MNRTDVDLFEKLVAQLNGFYQELSVSVKKSQTDAVNLFKLNFVNGVLRQCNDLGKGIAPFLTSRYFLLTTYPLIVMSFLLFLNTSSVPRSSEQITSNMKDTRDGVGIWMMMMRKSQLPLRRS